jgi:ferrous iron transport protein A
MNQDTPPPISGRRCVRMCPLDCLKPGCRASVASVSGDRELRRRLMEMGFCNETSIEMIARAPFGDPIEYRIRGYFVSLRSEQARNVMVSIAEEG